MATVSVNATYNYIVAAFADLPTAPGPGQWAYVTGTSTPYFSTDGTWVDMTPGGGGGVSDGDKGDITVSGSGATWTIDNDVVTYAKIQNVVTDRLLGRDTAGTGNAEELTVGGGVEFTGSGGIQTSALTGDVTKSAGGTSTTIANDAVTYAKMQNVSATDKVLGRSTAGSGDVEEIPCTAAGRAMIAAANATAQAALLGGLFVPYHYSFDNAPASPSSYDDEFTASSIDAKWTVSSKYTGSDPGVHTPVSGTVDPLATVSVPTYDLTTFPSWLLVQPESAGTGSPNYAFMSLSQSYSPQTNETFFMCFAGDNRAFGTALEGSVALQLYNTSDSNEEIGVRMENSGSARRILSWVTNNGSVSLDNGASISEKFGNLKFYIVLYKTGNVYRAGFAHADGPFTFLDPQTKTGVTTFDRFELRFFTANDTPTIINGCDFFRYYPSNTYALMN